MYHLFCNGLVNVIYLEVSGQCSHTIVSAQLPFFGLTLNTVYLTVIYAHRLMNLFFPYSCSVPTSQC